MRTIERAIYVTLPEPAIDALARLAKTQYRDTRRQAAMLVLDGLRHAGALPAEEPAGVLTDAAPEPRPRRAP